MKTLHDVLDALNGYFAREFNDDPHEFTDLSDIGVAYTTLGDNDEHDVQVKLNLSDLDDGLKVICLLDNGYSGKDVQYVYSYDAMWNIVESYDFMDYIRPAYEILEEIEEENSNE